MSHTCRNGRKVLLEDTLLGIAVEIHTHHFANLTSLLHTDDYPAVTL